MATFRQLDHDQTYYCRRSTYVVAVADAFRCSEHQDEVVVIAGALGDHRDHREAAAAVAVRDVGIDARAHGGLRLHNYKYKHHSKQVPGAATAGRALPSGSPSPPAGRVTTTAPGRKKTPPQKNIFFSTVDIRCAHLFAVGCGGAWGGGGFDGRGGGVGRGRGGGRGWGDGLNGYGRRRGGSGRGGRGQEEEEEDTERQETGRESRRARTDQARI